MDTVRFFESFQRFAESLILNLECIADFGARQRCVSFEKFQHSLFEIVRLLFVAQLGDDLQVSCLVVIGDQFQADRRCGGSGSVLAGENQAFLVFPQIEI